MHVPPHQSRFILWSFVLCACTPWDGCLLPKRLWNLLSLSVIKSQSVLVLHAARMPTLYSFINLFSWQIFTCFFGPLVKRERLEKFSYINRITLLGFSLGNWPYFWPVLIVAYSLWTVSWAACWMHAILTRFSGGGWFAMECGWGLEDIIYSSNGPTVGVAQERKSEEPAPKSLQIFLMRHIVLPCKVSAAAAECNGGSSPRGNRASKCPMYYQLRLFHLRSLLCQVLVIKHEYMNSWYCRPLW